MGTRLDAHAAWVDAVEINAMYTRYVNFNGRAIAWARAHGKPLVGNTDLHLLAQMGTTYTLVDAPPEPDAICDAIRHGRTEVRTGRSRCARRRGSFRRWCSAGCYPLCAWTTSQGSGVTQLFLVLYFFSGCPVDRRVVAGVLLRPILHLVGRFLSPVLHETILLLCHDSSTRDRCKHEATRQRVLQPKRDFERYGGGHRGRTRVGQLDVETFRIAPPPHVRLRAEQPDRGNLPRHLCGTRPSVLMSTVPPTGHASAIA